MNKTRREPFGRLPDGEESALYTLCAENGLCVSITNYGGTITSILAPDREGALGDVVLGYDTLDGYLTGRSYFGASIGRFGNRINRGRFTLDGTEYILNVNDGQHHLHGGPGGFDRILWRIAAEGNDDSGLTLTHLSRDGEEGYPGNLQVEVRYSLPTSDTLQIQYRAETDKPTPLNLTNHSYFNLAGHTAGDILDHELTCFAEFVTLVDEGSSRRANCERLRARPSIFVVRAGSAKVSMPMTSRFALPVATITILYSAQIWRRSADRRAGSRSTLWAHTRSADFRARFSILLRKFSRWH